MYPCATQSAAATRLRREKRARQHAILVVEDEHISAAVRQRLQCLWLAADEPLDELGLAALVGAVLVLFTVIRPTPTRSTPAA